MILTSLVRVADVFVAHRSLLYQAQDRGLANPWPAVPEIESEKTATMESVRFIYSRLNTPGSLDPRVAFRLLEAYAPHFEVSESRRFAAVVLRYLMACCRQDFAPAAVDRFAESARRWLTRFFPAYHDKVEGGRRPTPNEGIWKEKFRAAEQIAKFAASPFAADGTKNWLLAIAAQTFSDTAWNSPSVYQLAEVLRAIQRQASALSASPQAAAETAFLLVRLDREFRLSDEAFLTPQILKLIENTKESFEAVPKM